MPGSSSKVQVNPHPLLPALPFGETPLGAPTTPAPQPCAVAGVILGPHRRETQPRDTPPPGRVCLAAPRAALATSPAPAPSPHCPAGPSHGAGSSEGPPWGLQGLPSRDLHHPAQGKPGRAVLPLGLWDAHEERVRKMGWGGGLGVALGSALCRMPPWGTGNAACAQERVPRGAVHPSLQGWEGRDQRKIRSSLPRSLLPPGPPAPAPGTALTRARRSRVFLPAFQPRPPVRILQQLPGPAPALEPGPGAPRVRGGA